jgi:release factor glutamine methyltransferase
MTSSFTATLTVAQAIQHARQQGLDRLDAQLLLGATLQQSPTWLLAHDDAALNPAQQVQWLNWLHRRASGEPVAYILGDQEFFGLTLAVTPDVLIPRPDTETLVDWALEVLATDFPPAPWPTKSDAPLAARRPTVLDLGTGSGAIALALQHRRPDAHVTAVDASAAALQVARANAARLKLPVRFLTGNWLAPVGHARFDLILSNPPYIAEGDPHLAALAHEPKQALTAGPDGLNDLRHIITEARQHLAPGAWLLLEHGHDQAVAVSQLLANQAFVNVSTRFDLGGQPRCTGGQRPL